MNLIEQRIGGEWEKTRHGSLDRDEAIQQMITLCGNYVERVQKNGKRVKIDSGIWDNRLIMRVISGRDTIITSYSIKK